MIKIKSEPVDSEEMIDVQNKGGSQNTSNKIQDHDGGLEQSSVDTMEEGRQEKKVPPLRVKLTVSTSPTTQLNTPGVPQNASPSHHPSLSTLSQQTKSTKDLYSCSNCKFKSNNSYIFGRHRKSCDKKRRLYEKEHSNLESNEFDLNTTNDSTIYDGDTGEYHDTGAGALVHEPEDSIEVPVEFDGDNEAINNLSDTSNEKIIDVHMDVVVSDKNSVDGSKHIEGYSYNNHVNTEDDDFDDSHCSEDGEGLEVGPEEEMDESNEQSETGSTDYGVVSVEDKTDRVSDSDQENVELDTVDDPPSASEKLQQKEDDGKSETVLERSKVKGHCIDNGVENHTDDEENSLGNL